MSIWTLMMMMTTSFGGRLNIYSRYTAIWSFQSIPQLRRQFVFPLLICLFICSW
jgi:hypothetical protein